MRQLTRFAVLAERPESCARRLAQAGMAGEVAEEVAFYLDQARELEALADGLVHEMAALGTAVRVFDLGVETDWLSWLQNDPESAMSWNMTDGVRYFLGGGVAAAARLAGIAHFGSPASAQALAQDKYMIGATAAAAGLNVPPTSLARHGRWLSHPPPTPGPFFVKPRTLGAKIGIWSESLATSSVQALETARRIGERYGDDAVIQPYIEGRDIRVSYLAVTPDPGFEHLGVYELVEGGGDGFMTLADSHAAIRKKAGSVRRIDHPGIAAQSRRLAEVLGLQDLFSLDFRLDAQGRAWFLECEVAPAVTIYDFATYLADYWDCQLTQALPRAVVTSFARAPIASMR